MGFRELVDDDDQLLDRTLTGGLEPGQRLDRITFEACVFEGCVWDEAQVRACEFIECTFTSCSMSLTDCTDSTFAECTWRDCRILSVDWSTIHCNLLASVPMSFVGCRLTYSRFVGTDLRRWSFDRCDLGDTDFTDARLSGAVMRECDLKSAHFVNADMRGLDLSGSYDYLFDLRDNRVAGLRVGAVQGVNLLGVFGVAIVD